MSKKKKSDSFYMDVDTLRAIKTLRAQAMPTIFEAIVELLTNTDDAYETLFGKIKNYKGDCRIEYKRGGKENPTYLNIKDRAIGMSYEIMVSKLTTYLKKVTTSSRSFFGKGLKDITALGDITVKSIHDEKYSEMVISQSLKIEAIEKNIKANSKHKKMLSAKKHGTTIEVKIPAGSKAEYNPIASTIIEKLPQHYALSKILDKKEGTMNLSFYDANKRETHILTYTKPEAKKVVDEKTTFHDGSSAFIKIYRFDELMEESTEKKFQKTGISVFGRKACHDKTFFEKSIENNDLKDRYFGELQCDRISELLEEFDTNNSLNKKHPPYNNVPIIDTERLQGLNKNHPFVKNHLFKWASGYLKELIEKDKKNNEDNKSFTDKEMKKYIDDIFKLCSKELEMDEETDDTDSGSLGKSQWKVVPKGGTILLDQTLKLRVYTYKDNLKSGYNDVTLVSDSDYSSFLKVDKKNKSLLELENRPEVLTAKFELVGINENEQIFKIQHAGQVKTEFKIKVEKLKNKIFKNKLEFENDNYTVGLNKNRNLKIFAKVPDLLEKDEECRVTISDDEVIKQLKPCKLSVVDDSNFAEGIISIKGLKLNGISKISVAISGEQATAQVKVTEKPEEGAKYTWDIGPHEIASKRATWDSTKPSVLLISTKNSVVKRFLGSESQPFPNGKNPAWKVMLNEIICEKFGEKKVQLTARKDPMQYGDVAKQPSPEDVMKQAEVHFTKAKDLFVSKLMTKVLSDKEISLKLED